MKVFLSYTNKQQDLAHDLAQQLISENIEVLFDHENLILSDAHESFIRKAVEGAQIFIFLASSDSLRPGAHTLSELGFTQEKSLKAPVHIITVLTEGTELESLPTFLRSNPVFGPEGDFTAETVASVLSLIKGKRQVLLRRRVRDGIILAVLISLWYFTTRPPPPFMIKEVSAEKMESEIQFTATIQNSGSEVVSNLSMGPEADKANIKFTGSFSPSFIGVGKEIEVSYKGTINERKDNAPFNWRLCVGLVKASDVYNLYQQDNYESLISQYSETVCSPFRPWSD